MSDSVISWFIIGYIVIAVAFYAVVRLWLEDRDTHKKRGVWSKLWVFLMMVYWPATVLVLMIVAFGDHLAEERKKQKDREEMYDLLFRKQAEERQRREE